MDTDISYKAVIYGEVLSPDESVKINGSPDFCFKKDQSLFQIGKESTTVFVDLDDPDFADSSFLVSLATAGENITLIGKAADISLEETIRISKLGVSEILKEDQCLERLQSFLDDIEQNPPESAPEINAAIGLHSLIGGSSQTQQIKSTLQHLAEVDFPGALILGSTGTGKSLISKIMHHTGTRSDHNLVEVNCSAIPDELFESELFGHTKGAFTDAKVEKMGLFEYAQNGTLFLDEVGNLSLSAQAKLLKIIEDKKLRKVGDINDRDINVRVVTATNINLIDAIHQGKFREDLYFRLNLLTIEIPPLRERVEDIPDLIDYYLKFFSTLYNKPNISICTKGLQKMQNHPWPGNVRELSNVVERVVLLATKNKISLDDIQNSLVKGRLSLADRKQLVIDIPDHGISLEEVEQKVVSEVLNMFNWNKSDSASFLQISRPRLRRIIEKAGLEQNKRKQG